MQLKTIGEVSTVTKAINEVLKSTAHLGNAYMDNAVRANALAVATKNYSIETIKAAIAQGTFTEEQIRAILSAKGLTEAEIEEFIATNALSVSQAGATASTLGLGTAFKGLGVAIKNTTKAMWTWLATTPAGWVTAAIMAIGGVIFGLNKYAKSAKKASDKAQEVYEKSKEKIETNKQEAESLENLIEKYKELKSSSNIDSETRDEIKDIQYDIVDLVGAEAKGIDLVNGKLDDQLKTLKEITVEKAKQNMEDAKSAYYNASHSSDVIVGDADDYGNDVVVNWSDDAKQLHKTDDFKYFSHKEFLNYFKINGFSDIIRENYDSNLITGFKIVVDTTDIDNIEEKIKRLNELKAFLEDSHLKYTGLYQGVNEAIERYVSQNDIELEAANNLIDTTITYLSISDQELSDIIVNSAESFEQYRQKLIEKIKEDEDIEEMLSDGILSEDDLETSINTFMSTCEEFSTWYDEWREETSNIKSSISISDVFALEDAEGNATALSNLSDQLSDVEDAYNTCLSAKEEFDEQGYLSIDTLQKVLALGDEYLQYLFDEEGNVRLDAEAFQELTLARINDMEAQALTDLSNNIKQITDEAAATEYLTQKQYDLASSYADVAANALMAMTQIDGFANSKPLQNAYNSFVTQYEQIKSLFEKTKSGISTTYSGRSTSSSSSSKSSETDWKSILDSETDLLEKQLEAGLITFQEYIDKRRKIIEQYYRDGKISAEDYYDALEDMYDSQLDIYDKVLSAVERRFDREIDKIQDVIDAIEKQNEVLEKQKDKYDSILSVVDSVYEKQIDYIKSQQDAIQDTIDALQDENDERKLALQLEQAKWELYRAQTQRTKKIYNGTEFVYDTDRDAIREAQENLADLTLEKTINELEKEKDALDDVIEELEKYRDLWAEIPDTLENAQNEQLAIELWGQDYEKLILSNRLSDIENFKNNYVFIEKQINDNELLIDSYNEKVEYYENLKDQWSDITDAYENAMEDQYAAMILGANWESDVLSGRLDVLNGFKNEYIAIQNAITEAAKNSAQAQATAQSLGSATSSSGSSNSGSVSTTGAEKYKVVDVDTSTVYLNNATQSECNSYISSHNLIKVSTIGTTFMVKRGSTGGSTQKTMMAYASGTEHAKRGLNLVGEDGAETFIDNDGNVSLVTEPTLIPMEGGETVKNAKDTETLFNSDNIVPIDTITLPGNNGETLYFTQEELHRKLQSVIPSLSNLIQLPTINMPEYDLSPVQNNTTPVVQNITLTLPNVTNESGYERIQKELRQAQLDALQYAHRR